MSALAHIGHGIEKKLITAIVSSGHGSKLLEIIENRPGVLSVTHHHARGTGSRRMRPGKAFWSEKDVMMVLVEAPQADEVFQLLFDAGGIGEPHQGIIFMEAVRRGHPMMPFAT
ncbi:MAG: hypothetical protein QG616_846 [Pseudomonadota bacterium]|nr:hypothetical protein [Pseudomonadota bacterium]MDQ5881016.1 hypothetical protein [Pseudomonadota bacterium]MDQ5904786.1 hypothetical protein [Pseudomonadota bacterium]MDQ5905902.1 hypothetical protein [Pseudomonadota bacterium]MDQ5914256.1 hypothetical protein [Pseudomonadota bacterium]